MADLRRELASEARAPRRAPDVDELWRRGQRRRRVRRLATGAAGLIVTVTAIASLVILVSGSRPAVDTPVVGCIEVDVTVHPLDAPITELVVADGGVWGLDRDQGRPLAIGHDSDDARAPTPYACELLATDVGPAVRTCRTDADTLVIPGGDTVEIGDGLPAAQVGDDLWQPDADGLVARSLPSGRIVARVPSTDTVVDLRAADERLVVLSRDDGGRTRLLVLADRRIRLTVPLEGGEQVRTHGSSAWVLDPPGGRLVRVGLDDGSTRVVVADLTGDRRLRVAAGSGCTFVTGSGWLRFVEEDALGPVIEMPTGPVTGAVVHDGRAWIADGSPQVASVGCP